MVNNWNSAHVRGIEVRAHDDATEQIDWQVGSELNPPLTCQISNIPLAIPERLSDFRQRDNLTRCGKAPAAAPSYFSSNQNRSENV
jgi:hypothetical protein